MAKNVLYSPVILALLEKTLSNLGFSTSELNMVVYVQEKQRELFKFLFEILVSGFLIHAALFFVYFFLKIPLPWWSHLPLVFSYGLFHHYFLDWIPRKRNVEVIRSG